MEMLTAAATGARTDFYVAVAGVVPILLLALLFQLRLFEIVRLRESFGLGLDLYLVITFGGLAITEVLALDRLWEGKSENTDAAVVFLPVIWALVQLAGIPVMSRGGAILNHLPVRLRPWAEMGLILAFIALVWASVVVDLGFVLPLLFLVLITAMAAAFAFGGGSRLPNLFDRLDEADRRERSEAPTAPTQGADDPEPSEPPN
jgi:hypothetical protein